MPVIDTDTPEGKAELQKLIDKETDALKTKNAELLNEKKKLQTDFKSKQDELDEITAAKQKAEEDALAKSGDVEKIKASIEAKEKKEREKLELQLKAKDFALHKLLVDNGLTEALTKAGVTNAAHLKAAKALILSENKAEVAELEGNTVATIGGKSIQEFVSLFSQGDDGKHFVSAPNNGGGGASGSNGGGKASIDLDKLSPIERLTMAREKQTKT